MENFFLIFVCLFAGIAISQLRLAPADAHRGINAWLINIAMPSLSLRYIPDIHFDPHLLTLCLSPILIWIGAYVFVNIYAHGRSLDQATKAALFLTIALGNTGFVGFPLVSAYFGNEMLPLAIIFDQATFLLFSSLAFIVILRNTGSAQSNKELFRMAGWKLLRFPPFIACVLGFALPHFFDYSFAYGLLDRITATISPLALFSIGLQLQFGEWRAEWRNVAAGLSYKLIIAPLLVMIVALIFSVSGAYAKISVFEAATPSNVTVSLLATQYKLNARLCTLMVGASMAFCFVTTFLWYHIVNLLF